MHAGRSAPPRQRSAPRTFSSLFAPTSVPEFLAQHWNRRPLFAKAASWSKHLRFTLDELKSALPSCPDVKAQFFSDGRHRETAIRGEQAQGLHDAGLSICVTALERQLPALAAFAQRIRDEVRFAGDVTLNGYWSPAGGGFGTHFDAQHVFILQVDGSKRWFISEGRGCDAPPGNLVYAPDTAASFRALHPDVPLAPPDEATFSEHLLEPGDCLYLPPGTWHRTTAGDFSLSLSLTFAFVRLESLLANVARRVLERSPAWREALPLDGTGAAGIPPEWRRHLERRLAEFREFAAALTPELLAEEWLAATLGEAGQRVSGPDADVGNDDVLVREGRLELGSARDREGDDAVVLLWAGGRCRIPGDYRVFCRGLATATRFTLDEARRWTDGGAPLDAEETRDVLRQLVRAGLLRRG